MHVKLFKTLVPLLLIAVMLSACAKATDTPVETAAEESDELPSGDVSLRVWGAEEDGELIEQIISGFKSEYGSKANFTITFEPHSESGAKDEILGDVLNAPDVFTFADDQLMAFVASGVLKQVSNASEISGRNITAASEAASVNGTLYAYPLTADNGYFLFYNSKYLNETDVETVDSLLAATEKAGKQFFLDMTSGWYMYSFFGNTDMEIGLNDDGISTYCNWNAKYTNITGVDVAEAMLKICESPAFCPIAPDGFIAGVNDGTFIAGVSGVWDENSIKEAWGDDYAATKLPTYTVAGQQLQLSSYAGYKMVGINSYSANKGWAAVFADYMTNEKNQTLRFQMRGQGPSNLNASKSGDVANSKALLALQMQSDYASLQRVGGTYWDAATTFASAIADGNSSNKNLQVLLNEMVTSITGEESTGDAEGVESEPIEEEVAEEASEEETEEAAEEASEEASAESLEEGDEASAQSGNETTETEDLADESGTETEETEDAGNLASSEN